MRKKKRAAAGSNTSATVKSAPVPTIIPPESGRRISYEPGALFWCRDEPVQILGPCSTGFRVRSVRSGSTAIVQFYELEPLPIGSAPQGEAVVADVAEVSEDEWERARLLEAAIRSLPEKGVVTAAHEAAAAESVGLGVRQMRRLRARYEKNPTLPVLVRSRPGRKQGTTRLIPEEVEALMREVILREIRKSPDISVDALVTLIERECRMARLPAPGRSTTALRVKPLRADAANLPTNIGAEIAYRQAPVRGSLITTEALEVVQVDHTVCDVIIVDSQDRKPIGRPILTLAIDVKTGVILGMLLTLEAPSSLSVGLVLHHAVFPKDRWLNELGVPPGSWPGFGVPRALHLDNAKEFHGAALERGCDRYRIQLTYRRRGDPKMGGTIERVIGTCMGRVQLIPGATFSKRLQGRPRRTERRACFTLEELYQYLAGEVAQYHLKPRGTLNISPKVAWERAWQINKTRCYPELPENPAAFLVQFLPIKRRVVGRDGIPLFGLQYQSKDLHPLIKPGFRRPLRYDPRHMSVIYVECDDRKSHLVIPLKNPTSPAFSLWEWNEIRQRQGVPLYPADARVIEAALVKNREMIHRGDSARRSLRKGRRQERERQWRAVAPVIAIQTPPDPDPLKIVSRTEEGPYTCDVLE